MYMKIYISNYLMLFKMYLQTILLQYIWHLLLQDTQELLGSLV